MNLRLLPLAFLLSVLHPLSQASAAEPEIWLAPEDSIKRANAGEPPGDFMGLFPPDAPWKTAASRVQVFEIYPQFLGKSSDEQLRTVIEGLQRRNIALAISYGMLHRPQGAEMHEGYGAELAERDIAKLQRVGADVRYVVADEPLLFGHFFWGVGAPPLPIPDLAKDFVSTARLFRKAFPQVKFGMDDPILLYKDEEWTPAMIEFLESYKKEFGEPMSFVRLECASFQVREWLPRYKAAADLFHSLGVKFGALVTGDATDTSDAQWIEKAVQRYTIWESDGRPTPDQVVFQSWMPRPVNCLPETNPDTLTHLVNSYFRDRTSLTVNQSGDHLQARLLDSAGHPLANAPVAFTMLPGFGDPKMIRRTVEGRTPAGTQFVQMGLRLGIEGSRAGHAHFMLGTSLYSEAGTKGQTTQFDVLPDLKAWGKKGDATLEFKTEGATSRVEITASPGQTLHLNSRTAPASPERHFHFEFDIHVQPGTETGYLAIFFFDANKKVIARLTELLVPENPRPVQTLTTDTDGKIDVPISTPELKEARELQLSYPGDDQHRPAFATVHPAP